MADLGDNQAVWSNRVDYDSQSMAVNFSSPGMQWNYGEPDATAGACVAGHPSMFWEFRECDEKLPFVCKTGAFPEMTPGDHKHYVSV